MPSSETDDSSPLPGFQGRFAAELISARAAELADLAATQLISTRPEIAARYRPLPRQKWAGHFEARVGDLAAALFAESPAVFAAQVAWAKAAFLARGTPLEDLQTSLVVLQSVVLRETTPEDAPLLNACFAHALTALEAASADIPSRLSTETPHGQVASRYLLKILEGDRMAAAEVVHDAVKQGLSIRHAYLDVLIPVQRELGRMWHLNEITVAEEHFATSTTHMVMSQLLPHASMLPRDGRAVLTAAVEGNTHDLGLRVLADFFEMAGWRAVYLGASVPIEDLVSASVDFRAHVAALSAALPTQIPTLERTIQAMRHSLGDACPKIIIGGAAFCDQTRDLWQGLGADGFADTADAAVALANRLAPTPSA
jgi:methanogenic corrinoid protein MtbC1